MNSRLLDRFLRYVAVDTTAHEGADAYPSSPGQFVLGRILVDELLAMGLADARQDENGIVMATLPGSQGDCPDFRAEPQRGDTKMGLSPSGPPTIAFCAHLDTSPETSGAGVRPQVIANYAGGDIVLPGDKEQVIRTADNPELATMLGQTIVTSDGTTLLGADDKAGVAVIMEAAERLVARTDLTHGPIRLCFTCDEEIGRGVDKLDVGRLGAAVCYTLDGHGRDEVDVETFSADAAVVSIRGKNIHPSIAKAKMVNAVRAAGDFLARLPLDRLTPETTDGRDGFLHAYEIAGGVAETRARILLRDFDSARLEDLAAMLRAAALATESAFPGARVDVAIQRQYRNMADGLRAEPRAVALASRALERLGRSAKLTLVRGGTDGSRLTELGLPTPNLSCGEHNPHSPLEWTCLEEMTAAVDMLIELAHVWGNELS